MMSETEVPGSIVSEHTLTGPLDSETMRISVASASCVGQRVEVTRSREPSARRPLGRD